MSTKKCKSRNVKRPSLFDEDTMRKAVFKVVKRGYSIRGVAASTGLSYATLRKYVFKYNNTQKENRESLRFFPNYEVNLIFSRPLEDKLEEYILTARKLHYGLTTDIIKRLSYDLAIKHELKIPKSWELQKKAGKHWLYGYLKRHPLICDILSWSRKFRQPNNNKKQFNTTVEMANRTFEPAQNSEDGIEEFIEMSPKNEADSEDKPVVIISLKKQKKSNS